MGFSGGRLVKAAIPTVAALLAVGVLAAAHLAVESAHEREHAALQERSEGLAELTRRIVETQVSHGFGVLRALKDMRDTLSDEEFAQRLAAIAESDGMITNIGVLDAEGRLVASSVGATGASFADRRYFRELAQGQLVVLDDPAMGRVTQRWILPVALARQDRDGGLAGVFVLGLAVDELLAVFDEIIANGLDLVVLLRPGGRVVLHAARPAPALASLFDPVPSLPLRHGLPTLGSGYHLTTRPLAGTELSVVLGLDLERALGSLEASARQTYAAAGTVALLLLLLGIGVALHLGRQQRAEQSLREMMAEATAASEAKTRFIASMNHELRTPLNAVIGFSQMLSLPGFAERPEKVREYAELIAGSGRHLLGIVDHVLEVSRFARSGYRPRLEPVAVEPLVRQTLRLFSEAHARELRVEPRPGEGPRTALLDPTACRQILLNLLDNAAKHAPDSSSIELGWEERGGRLVLTVADRGPGFAPRELRRLGEPFYRGSAARVTSSQGLGIGLSVVRFLAEAHGGKVGFANRPGGGALVTVELPLDAAGARPEGGGAKAA